MEDPPVGSLALSGAGYGPLKSRPNTPTRPAGKTTPRALNPDAAMDPALVPKITAVHALIKELRRAIHAMFCTVDQSIPSSSAHDNYSRQAFRFFTTTNTITPECFQTKVVRLGLRVTPRLCTELFRRIDQEDLGEIDYPTFAQRVFLPETFFSADETSSVQGTESPTSTAAEKELTNRLGLVSPRAGTNKVASAGPSVKKPPALHEYMTLDELQKFISRKLDAKTSRSADPVGEAFRFFTNSEVIAFADFHRQLAMLQINLSPPKCRELFVYFDKDRDGVIDTIEFTTSFFCNQDSRPSTARSLRNNQGEPDQEPRLSTKQLLAMVREKMDRLSEETDRFQQAFMLFGKPSGISPHDLRVAMKRLGMKLSEKQLLDLFATFDFDKTGDLDVNKFVQGVMLDDDSTSFWLSVKDRQKVDDSRRKLYSMTVQSIQESWTIADIERMLREKIEQRTSRSSDCFRQAFKIFKKVNGIKPHEFHESLAAIGLALTRAQSDILFCRFDKDGSGDIDLNEFIHGVLPPDYKGISWVAAADELHRIEAQNKKAKALANPDQYMTEIEMESWSLDEIEMRIRDKIQQATSRSSDTFRQAYKIFKKASHVTIDEFRERLLTLGFRLTPAQCTGLFKRYDTDNSNDLDLQEFCLKILPPDYTHDGDHWSHSEKFKKERHRQKLEYVKRSKNGLITLPKFIESHRFTRGRHVSHTFEGMQQGSMSPFGSSDGGSSRPSTSSTIEETTRPTTPQPPRTPRPPTPSMTSPEPPRTSRPPTASMESPQPPRTSRPQTPSMECNPQHLLSPRASSRTASLSSTSPQATCSPRKLRATTAIRNSELQGANSVQATPPASPRVASPTNPMSSRGMAASLQSPHHNSRPATPRQQPLTVEEPAIEYEDEEVIEDDAASMASLDLSRAKMLTRHRRKHGKSSRHHHDDNSSTTSSQVSVRQAESVVSCSAGSAVGTAKHMPQRNHVLLIRRYMQAARKGPDSTSSKSAKRVTITRR